MLRNVPKVEMKTLTPCRNPSGRFWADAVYHEQPSVTLERLARLESVMLDEIKLVT
jgi:hypothetical protein